MQRENSAIWGVEFLRGFAEHALELASKDVYIYSCDSMVVAGSEEKNNPVFYHVGIPKCSAGLLFDLSNVCRDIFTSMEAAGIEPGEFGDGYTLGVHSAHYLVAGEWRMEDVSEEFNTALAESCERISISYAPDENTFFMGIRHSDGSSY